MMFVATNEAALTKIYIRALRNAPLVHSALLQLTPKAEMKIKNF